MDPHVDTMRYGGQIHFGDVSKFGWLLIKMAK